MRPFWLYNGVIGSWLILLSSSLPLAAQDDLARPQSQVEAGPPDTSETEITFATTTLDAANLDAVNSAEAGPMSAAAQAKKQAALKKAVAGAYAPVFYNNNFSYLNDPAYDDWHFGEDFKQLHLGDCWTLDLGGQYRARLQAEDGFRGAGLTGSDDDFLLQRLRLYANAKYGDRFRVYAEFIDADSNYENFPPRPIDVNRADMLNLFADVGVYGDECTGGKLTARLGRQEMLEGAQRLISPLDWANTRRTFEGLNFLWRGDNWNADTFYVRPVIVNSIHFDSPSYRQEFFGTYATYKAIKDQTVDLYALQYNNAQAPSSFQFTTLGNRWQGAREGWLWETETAVQFGQNSDNSDHIAGMLTGGVGHKWDDGCWKPVIWAYYDWASGGDVLGAGQGFNQLFPLAHKYLGFMDLYGRSNIQTPNVQFSCKPTENLTLLCWYYYFFLQTINDTPYNTNGTPFKPGSPPASADLGHEIDLTATYSLTPRMDVLLGYSHFFAGNYYKLTPGLNYRDDANFYYVQYQWNF